MYGGSFLYHVGGDQPLVSLGLVVSYCISFVVCWKCSNWSCCIFL